MQGEFVLLCVDQLRDAAESADVHSSFDFVLVNIEDFFGGNHDHSLLSPLVLVDLLDFLAEQDGLCDGDEKVGAYLLFSSSGMILASFATF
jgi:hypothetical protein